ncbi:hypothetical protein MM236_14320 [Belliella sp. DSM 107340]|uniref:EF-hand domain-containing protein n=1 Tax=Belliella calami TaxID=2923436 RepID=A0ABS9URC5_9BACT|nr:hypothetical protein [Belliella calami]MCH7399176.1 hypothetical protein [Belliella calami]
MSVVASHIEKPKTKNRSTNSPNKESQSLIDSKPIWSENSMNLDQDSLLDDTSNSFLLQDSLFPATESDASSGKANSSPTSEAASSSSENTNQPTVEIPEMEVLQGESNTEGQALETSNEEAISYPSSPYEDPSFNALVNASEQVATQTSQHENPEVESQRAQRAAPIAANESMGAAQTSQVEAMAAQEPNEFDAAGFKAALMAQIVQMQLPANAEEATEFDQHNNLSEIQNNATSQVNQEQEQSAGPIAATSEAEPAVDAVVAREIEEIPDPNIGETPASISANRSMPSPRPEGQVSTPLQDNVQEVEQQMESNNISEQQLANANEPSFTNALNSTESVREHADSAPDQFRAGEQSTLGATAESAENISQSQLQEMHGDRQASFEGLAQTQEQTGANDSAERTRIAADINAIYEKTKAKVEGILHTLEEKVTQMFTEAATKAKQLFEQYVDRKMRAYKAERYSGADGALRWGYDKLAGMPDEVNDFFTEGRQVYIDYIDKALDPIAEKVANELNLAKNTIQEGRNEIAKYVAELPENLQSIGTEAAETIQSQFDSLDDSVNEKQTALVDSLAAQYMESLQEVDARIEEMQAENRGLIDMAMDAIGEVIGVIIALKDMFLNLLSAIADVVNTIIEDPIGFLKNLFSGIALGLENFGKNILTHLQAGLIGWLTGAMGNVGIQMPEDIFSLKGIFSLASQILGFTWDRVRAIGVKVIGEPVMKAFETGFEIIMILKNEGLTGLWEYIKEQFNDLKELVIEGIKTMIRDTIIGAGIKWLLGLLSPVGAFIKAAMAIIDVVTFFVQKAAQIIELVSAFVESVRAVASGSITAVANAIEGALARAIPLVIGFLANLLGIGDLANKVVAIITKIQERVAKSITKLWMKIKELGKSFLKRLGFGGDKDSKNDPEKDKKIADGEKFLIEEDKRQDRDGDGKLTIDQVQEVARKTKAQHPVFKSITPRLEGKEWKYDWKGSDGTTEPGSKTDGDSTSNPNGLPLLDMYLKKVIFDENNGGLSQSFSNAVNGEGNLVEGKKVYFTQERVVGGIPCILIMRGANMADKGYEKLAIVDNKLVVAEEGYHRNYIPETISVSKEGKVFKAQYKTKTSRGEEGPCFEVKVRFDEISKEVPTQIQNRIVEGKDLRFKENGIPRGATDSAGGGFDNAHLVGDRFGGSGRNAALNIYPSSPKYNRQIMLSKENLMALRLPRNMPYNLKISAYIEERNFIRASNLQKLLTEKFDSQNPDPQNPNIELDLKNEMQANINKDLKDLPGQFVRVDYHSPQYGINEKIGKDEDYEKSVEEFISKNRGV